MITICTVKQNEMEDIQNFLSECNSQIIINDSHVVMAVKDGSEIMGAGVLSQGQLYGFINGIIIKDEHEFITLGYGLGKAILNFIDRRGIRDVYTIEPDNPIKKEIYKRLGFKTEKNIAIPKKFENGERVMYLNLENYFMSACCHQK